MIEFRCTQFSEAVAITAVFDLKDPDQRERARIVLETLQHMSRDTICEVQTVAASSGFKATHALMLGREVRSPALARVAGDSGEGSNGQ